LEFILFILVAAIVVAVLIMIQKDIIVLNFGKKNSSSPAGGPLAPVDWTSLPIAPRPPAPAPNIPPPLVPGEEEDATPAAPVTAALSPEHLRRRQNQISEIRRGAAGMSSATPRFAAQNREQQLRRYQEIRDQRQGAAGGLFATVTPPEETVPAPSARHFAARLFAAAADSPVAEVAEPETVTLLPEIVPEEETPVLATAAPEQTPVQERPETLPEAEVPAVPPEESVIPVDLAPEVPTAIEAEPAAAADLSAEIAPAPEETVILPAAVAALPEDTIIAPEPVTVLPEQAAAIPEAVALVPEKPAELVPPEPEFSAPEPPTASVSEPVLPLTPAPEPPVVGEILTLNVAPPDIPAPPPVSAPPAEPAPAAEESASTAIYRAVRVLLSQGLEPPAIAKQLGIGLGEVILIRHLDKKER
jgi:hypothetical protein